MLLVPTVAVLAFVGLRVAEDLDNVSSLSELDKQVQLEESVADVVHELQRERDLTVRLVVAQDSGGQSELTEQRQDVDEATAAFRGQWEAAESDLSGESAARFRQVGERLDRLRALRGTIDNSQYPGDAILRSYNELVQGVHDTSEQAVASIQQPELSRLVLATNALARAEEQVSRKRAVLLAGLERGTLTEQEQRDLQAADAELSAAVSDFRKFATDEQQRMYDDTVMGQVVDRGNGMEAAAMARARNGESLDGMDVQQWDIASTYTLNRFHDVHGVMLKQTREHTEALVSASRESVIRDTAITGAILIAALGFALVIARSLLRPLRTLRTSALDVADYRLPEEVDEILADPDPERRATIAPDPVPVSSNEEVGQVARAFDAVHSEAVRLAAEQALLRDNVNAMFVNLSRRSQALVERQLNVLDRMESDEQDPDQLANLFELDHMATRMRRNSENLLVLGGSDLGRQVTEPITAAEVIGAAVSEIEQYARIEVAPTPQRMISGNAVNDVVHVISELLDNATAFSDPATKVSVDATSTRTGGLRIEITDHGVGMPDDDIAATNERLTTPPAVDVSVARRMGLYVVGRLAQRHQIRVRLRRNDQGGITAGVLVPPELVNDAVFEAPPAAIGSGTGARPPVTGHPDVADSAQATGTHSDPGQPDVPSATPLPQRTPPARRTAEPEPQWPGGADTDVQAGSPAQVNGSPQAARWEWPPRPAEQPPEEAPAPEDQAGREQAARGPGRHSAGEEPGSLFDDGEAFEPGAETGEPAAGELSALEAEAPTVRMPIYEAVLSQWFSASTANGTNSPAEGTGKHSNGDAATSQWHTPADIGWQAAQGLEGEQPVSSDTTAAGLPKRVPKARLVPGSAGEQEQQQSAVLPKTAEAARGRMSSLQQGVRRGRHALQHEYPEQDSDAAPPGVERAAPSEEGQ